jgi:hypothetical protein
MECKRLKISVSVHASRPLSGNIDYTTIATQRNQAVNEKMHTLVQGRSKTPRKTSSYTGWSPFLMDKGKNAL